MFGSKSSSSTDITTISTAVDQRTAGADEAIVVGQGANLSMFDREALGDILDTTDLAISGMAQLSREAASYGARESAAAFEIAAGDRGIAKELAQSVRGPESSQENMVFYAVVALVAWKLLS